MQLSSVNTTEKQEGKTGVFYFVCNVIRGYRYRYLIVWNEKSLVDKSAKFNKNSKGRETNYVEVNADSGLTDFVSQFNPDLNKEEAESIPDLSKIKSIAHTAFVSADLLKKTGVVLKKMQTITEFDDLSLIDKMKRHQCLIAALNEYSIMMDVY